jgi:hypothetical protein
LTRVVLYSLIGFELAVLQIDNNKDASMNRAHAELREVALVLARYLDRELRGADPNPAAPAHNEPKRIVHEPQAATAPALVADLEYSLREAATITHKAEVTLRKMIQRGRLQCRKDGSNRVLILGKDLVSMMTKQLREPTAAQDSVSEGVS